jgi:hypothetical protein
MGSIHSKNLAMMFKWLWNLDKSTSHILQMAFLCLQILYLQFGVAWYLQFS